MERDASGFQDACDADALLALHAPILHADDRDLGHGGVARDDRLELLRRDLHAAADDEVAGTTDEPQPIPASPAISNRSPVW